METARRRRSRRAEPALAVKRRHRRASRGNVARRALYGAASRYDSPAPAVERGGSRDKRAKRRDVTHRASYDVRRRRRPFSMDRCQCSRRVL